MTSAKRSIRCVPQERFFDSVAAFDPKYAVTRGEFSIDVDCPLGDMEWNQMDQLHRPFVHNTYEKNLRIALGRDFAVSLTRWGRWPFLITVTDVRVQKGVFYQDMVLAGVIYVHNIITFTETAGITRLKHEWIICSHRFLKFTHAMLSRMYHKLNVKLQAEDNEFIRSRRAWLRKAGYRFRSDPPDFYTANLLTNNTIYPPLEDDAFIALGDVPQYQLTACTAGDAEFLIRREGDEVQVWPGACPHEGGELAKGMLSKDCRLTCPWHGLKFSAAVLSPAQTTAQAYGFEYRLKDNRVYVRNVQQESQPARDAIAEDSAA